MITVVIPVFNAARFLQKSVESAVSQDQVSEILLIEDGSPDDSLDVCMKMRSLSNKVKLFQHPNGANRGAGESRNLGVKEASNEFISFLDADDFYLPDRFKKTIEVLQKNPDADGVYEAIGNFTDGAPDKITSIYTIKKHIDAGELFHYLIRGTYGHFHTNGLTVKRALLLHAGLFNESLRLHQDSEMWLRIAFHGRLFPGEIKKPVTMVRRHDSNRIVHANAASRVMLWKAAMEYFIHQPIRRFDFLLILLKYNKFQTSAEGTSKFLGFIRLISTSRLARKLLLN